MELDVVTGLGLGERGEDQGEMGEMGVEERYRRAVDMVREAFPYEDVDLGAITFVIRDDTLVSMAKWTDGRAASMTMATRGEDGRWVGLGWADVELRESDGARLCGAFARMAVETHEGSFAESVGCLVPMAAYYGDDEVVDPGAELARQNGLDARLGPLIDRSIEARGTALGRAADPGLAARQVELAGKLAREFRARGVVALPVEGYYATAPGWRTAADVIAEARRAAVAARPDGGDGGRDGRRMAPPCK